MKYQFKTNIMCGSCIAKAAPFLDGNTGIKNWEVNTQDPSKILTVEADGLTSDMVKDIVNKAGYKAESLNESCHNDNAQN